MLTNAEICKAGSDDQGCYLWHWHISLYRELERTGTLNIPALAGNLKSHSGDVSRWADDLERAGLIVDAEPLWDYPARWITLAS